MEFTAEDEHIGFKVLKNNLKPFLVRFSRETHSSFTADGIEEILRRNQNNVQLTFGDYFLGCFLENGRYACYLNYVGLEAQDPHKIKDILRKINL